MHERELVHLAGVTDVTHVNLLDEMPRVDFQVVESEARVICRAFRSPDWIVHLSPPSPRSYWPESPPLTTAGEAGETIMTISQLEIA